MFNSEQAKNKHTPNNFLKQGDWVMFARWQAEARFQAPRDLVKLPHCRDLVLCQILCYSPPLGKEIQSNARGTPGFPVLGLNIDLCIRAFFPQGQSKLSIIMRCPY